MKDANIKEIEPLDPVSLKEMPTSFYDKMLLIRAIHPDLSLSGKPTDETKSQR